jgi:drug/metabolite transporter (DMT)-like permease
MTITDKLNQQMISLKGNSTKFWAYTAIIGANIIWGINYVVSKKVVPTHIDPEAITMFRVLGASLLFWVASLFYKYEKVEIADLARMFFAALFGVALNQYLFINGIAKTTPIDAAIIITLNPILVLLLSSLFLHDKITSSKIVGIIIGGFGAISLITYSGTVSFGQEHLLGNILILGNATAYALYLVIVKPTMSKYGSITVMKWVFLFGMLQLTPICIGPFMKYNLLSQTSSVIGDIAFIVIGATFLAYLFTSLALTHIKASTVSIFAYTQPAIAAIFAIFIGMDGLSWIKMGSMILVCIGVYIASRPSIAIPFVNLKNKP